MNTVSRATQKQVAFAKLIAKGISANRAYEVAYAKKNTGGGSKTANNPIVMKLIASYRRKADDKTALAVVYSREKSLANYQRYQQGAEQKKDYKTAAYIEEKIVKLFGLEAPLRTEISFAPTAELNEAFNQVFQKKSCQKKCGKQRTTITALG